jgi:hypothetical protein
VLFVVTHSVAVARIFREDLPRVTTSYNRLGLSLSKRIRHGLKAKINGKRRPRTCEALGQISMGHSRARHVPGPIFSPRLTTSCPVRRGERARVFLPFFSPSYTCKGIESNSPFKYAFLYLH